MTEVYQCWTCGLFTDYEGDCPKELCRGETEFVGKGEFYRDENCDCGRKHYKLRLSSFVPISCWTPDAELKDQPACAYGNYSAGLKC